MKLTSEILRSLIKEVVQESKKERMVLSEQPQSFPEVYKDLSDANGPAQFAFITAHNPPGRKTSENPNGFSWNNYENQRRLIIDLKKKGYRYIDGEGVYGGDPEESFMVFSDSNKVDFTFKSDMIKLGKKYMQDAIVYGEKHVGAPIDTERGEFPVTPSGQELDEPAGAQPDPSGPRIFFKMHMVLLKPTKDGKTASEFHDYEFEKSSNLFLTGDKIQDRKNFYTVMKTVKSYIPFYEKEKDEFIANPAPVKEE